MSPLAFLMALAVLLFVGTSAAMGEKADKRNPLPAGWTVQEPKRIRTITLRPDGQPLPPFKDMWRVRIEGAGK